MAWLSAVVAAACVLASFRRLFSSTAPTSLDAGELCRWLVEPQDFPRIAVAVESAPKADWERDLFAAFGERDDRLRDARVNELLTEVSGRVGTWSRVPRVCASLATSAGFLFALVSLLTSWDGEASSLTFGPGLVSAVDAFSFGVAGAAFCVVVHMRATRSERVSLAALDRLIERMHSLVSAAQRALPETRPQNAR